MQTILRKAAVVALLSVACAGKESVEPDAGPPFVEPVDLGPLEGCSPAATKVVLANEMIKRFGTDATDFYFMTVTSRDPRGIPHIYRAPHAGGPIGLVWEEEPQSGTPSGGFDIVVTSTEVLWTTEEAKVTVFSKSDHAVRTLAGSSAPRFAQLGDTVFWSGSGGAGGSGIQAYDSSRGARTVVSGAKGGYYIGVAGAAVFWADSKSIYTAPVEGGPSKLFLTEAAPATTLVGGGGQLYWESGGSIRTSAVDAPAARTLDAGGGFILAADSEYVYLVARMAENRSQLRRRSWREGSTAVTLLECNTAIFSAVLQPHDLYFATGKTIARLRL